MYAQVRDNLQEIMASDQVLTVDKLRATARPVAPVQAGLKGVVVAESEISAVDGEEGTLSYRGIDIGDLADNSTYEETVYLLWYKALPTAQQLQTFRDTLAHKRDINAKVWQIITLLPGDPEPMDLLRTAVPLLSCRNGDNGDRSLEHNLAEAQCLIAQLPTILANYYRHLKGQPYVEPDPQLNHAENFLFMLQGTQPTPLQAKAMDLCMLLMAEHGFNASTFAARVTASTLSDMYSAITTAIGTMKGRLHGGANRAAMEMLLEISSEENVEPYITAALAAKKRIMGFGHRVYKKGADPRSAYLRQMLYQFSVEQNNFHFYNLATAVADTVAAQKELYPNVDFYTAPLLYTLGIPLELFTPIFAISRLPGWITHVMEQYSHNQLLRPLSRYVGPQNRSYTPLDER